MLGIEKRKPRPSDAITFPTPKGDILIGLDPNDIVPFLSTLNLFDESICKFIRELSVLLAVSVIFTNNAVGVPVVFQVPAIDNAD